MSIVLDIVLAFTEGIPELNGLVTRTGDNLPVISTEADRQNIGSVTNELTGGETGIKVPETECMIPGGRKGELAVRGDDDVGNEVVVAVENALWVAVGIFITSQGPNNDGFVYASHTPYT